MTHFRLLEAQIATGGLIDPQAGHRVPIEVAFQRGLFDERMNNILVDPSDDTKVRYHVTFNEYDVISHYVTHFI